MITEKPVVHGSIFNKPQQKEEISENIPVSFILIKNKSSLNFFVSNFYISSNYHKLLNFNT